MPNYTTHKKIGLIVSIVVAVFVLYFFYDYITLTKLEALLLPVIVLFYANIPDLDHPLGKLRKKVLYFIFGGLVLSSIISYFINLYIFLLLLTVTGILGIAMISFKHRGPLHSPIFAVLVSVPLFKLHWFLALLGFVSMMSHIIFDFIISKLKRKVKKLFGFTEQREYNFNFKF